MKNITKYDKHILIAFVRACLLVLVASAFFMPSFVENDSDGYNIYRVSVNSRLNFVFLSEKSTKGKAFNCAKGRSFTK